MHAPDLQSLAGTDSVQLRFLEKAVFGKTPAGKAQGQRSPIDWDGQFPEKIGKRSDVILMPVSEDHGLDLLPVFQQVSEFWDDEIHP